MMIIDDRHRIAFIHIPKCAGTTIRQYLQPYDRSMGAHTARVDTHPALGLLDYVHIPLFVLKEHFPEEFRLIREYWSFAVVRDPYKRFASSISQRVRMYGAKAIQDLTDRDMAKELESCIEYLSKHAEKRTLLPPEYIHFQRQVDYIYLDSERLVDCIYSTSQIEKLTADVLVRMGRDATSIERDKVSDKNKTIVYKNGLYRFIFSFFKPIKGGLSIVLPKEIKNRIKDVIFTDRDAKMGHLFESAAVKSFIEDYYREDIKIFKEVVG